LALKHLYSRSAYDLHCWRPAIQGRVVRATYPPEPNILQMVGGPTMRRVFALAFLLALAASLSGWALAGSPNGSAGQMPAYYDDHVFTINFKELPSSAEQAHLRNNTPQINTIYMSDQAMAAGFDFVSVLDAIQGDGFN